MIQRISHIGIVVRDLDAAVRLWSERFGLKPFQRVEVAVEGIRSVLLSAGGTPDEMAIELLTPIDPDDMGNAVARRLAEKGEGFYHLAVEVDDVEASGPALAEHGLRVLERPPALDGLKLRWLVHPRSAHGVLVELLESRDG